MLWRHRPVLFVTGLALACLGIGLVVGAKVFRPRIVYRDVPLQTAGGNQEPPSAVDDSSSCVDFRNAASLVGKSGCVSGMVQSVYTSASGNTFLDFCENFRNCPFTSLVFARDKSNFGDLSELRGQRVELRGEISSYQGRPEVVVRTPDQIRRKP